MKQVLLFLSLLFITTTAGAQAVGGWSNTGPIPFPINVSGQVDGIGRVSQVKFHPTNPAKMYAVSASGGLFISSDTGHNWAPTNGSEVLPQTSCSAVCIDYTNDQTLYLSLGDADYYGSNYGIYKSTNGGATWAASNSGIGTAMAVEILMHPTNNQVLVAATNNGIYKTSNGGSSWTLKQSGVFKDMKGKPGTGSLVLYATTASIPYYSTDFGDTWTAATGVTAPTNNDGMRLAVSPAAATTVYLAATDNNGVIWKSTNSGVSYTQIYTSTSQCIVCYDASVTSGTQGNYNLDINANPTNANELLLVAHCVWRSTDGGVTWTKQTDWYNQMHTDMHNIQWNPYNNNQRWCANDGGVWVSTDPQAITWSPSSDGLAATEVYHAAQSPVVRELVSIGTQDNGELYYTNGLWKCNRGGDWGDRNEFDYSTTGTVYYLESSNKRDLLPLGGDVAYNTPYTGTNNARIAFVPNLPNVAFLGKDSIWRSDNINSPSPSWTLIKPTVKTIRALAVSAADSNILFVISSGANLYRSKNALSATPTFTTIPTPGSVANAASFTTDKNNPAIVFISCGASVYRSVDTGNTWTNINGTGLSGLNIRRIIHDDYSTTERLFVNEGSYVHYKDNSTTAWTATTGLPTVANASDFMIYNNGTNASILRLSTYGRGVWQCDINANLPPSPDFTADKQYLCPNDTVHFTSTTFGNVTSYSWSFPGGTPATATGANPAIVYHTAGVYPVTLTATNANGSNSITKTSYITVSIGQVAAVQEGFEGATYPPTDWQLESESGSDWALSTGIGGYGASNHSIVFDNYNIATDGAHDRILAPKVSLAGVSAAKLTFDVAYAQWGPSQPDSLQVRLSTDCGQTWTTIYNKTGTALATAPDNTTSTYIPAATEWRTETVSLTPYIGNGIWLSFDNIGHYGQAIYLDNINITPSPIAAFHAADTSICAGATAMFTDSSTNATSWAWSFPGGTPATAATQAPTVTYATAGTYAVTLTATNSAGSGALTKTGYITVHPLPLPVITQAGGVLTATGATGTYQWYLAGNPVPGATAATFTPSANGAYTVSVTNSDSCTGTSAIYNYTQLGIAVVQNGIGFQLFPNPSSGIVSIKLSGIPAAEATIRCYNAAGQLVRHELLKTTGSTDEATYNWNGLAKGVYDVQLEVRNTRLHQRLVIE